MRGIVNKVLNSSALQQERIGLLQERIRIRKGILGCGIGYTAALCDNGRIVFAGDNRWGQAEAAKWTNVVSIATAPEFILGLMEDGTIRAAGLNSSGQLDVCSWSCAEVIACGAAHSCAILQNGKVVCAGDNSHGQCETDHWVDVCDICCGDTFTVGLYPNGKVTVAGGSVALHYTLSRWEGIVGVFTDMSGRYVFGILSDGSIVSNRSLPYAVRKWKNIVYLSVSDNCYCAIGAGGIVNVYGDNKLQNTLNAVNEEYILISRSEKHTAYVNGKGEVKTFGDNHFGQCDIPHRRVLFSEFTDFCTQRKADQNCRRKRLLDYKIRECESERIARRVACSERITAIVSAAGRVYTTGSFHEVKDWHDVCAISCGNAHLLALHSNGKVSASGNNVDGCTNVSSWSDIIEIFAAKYHSLACTSNGEVLFCGSNEYGQGDVSDWTGVKKLYGTNSYTLGLRADGTVLATGRGLPCDKAVFETEQWRDIIALCATRDHIAALRQDGSVICAGNKAYEASFRGVTATWRDVKQICAGDGFTVGLCYGGRVLAAGKNNFGQCNTDTWNNIVAVSAGRTHTVGIRSDGSVCSAGAQRLSIDQASKLFDSPLLVKGEKFGEDYIACNTDQWQDIVAIKCGSEHTVAVDRGGQMFACGLDGDGQCAVASFGMFSNITQYDRAPLSNKINLPESEANDDFREQDSFIHNILGDDNILKGIANGALVADSARYREFITGSDSHITILNENGRVRSYSFNTGFLTTESATQEKVTKIVSGRSTTLILYENGEVRIRNEFDAEGSDAELIPPPNSARKLLRAVDIAAGDSHSVILYEDGTLRPIGSNKYGQCDVVTWTQVKSVYAAGTHTVALCEDGRVVATGDKGKDTTVKVRSVAHTPRWSPCNTEKWHHISKIECAPGITVALCDNRSVLAVGTNNYGQCRTGFWYDVIDVRSSGKHTAALFSDGHVEAIGCNERGECDTRRWSNIVMIAVRSGSTFGLRSDGRVFVAGRCDCSLDLDVAVRAVFCFGQNLVLLGADGYLLAQCGGVRQPLKPIKDFRLFTPGIQNGILNRFAGENSETDILKIAVSAKCQMSVGLSHLVTITKEGQVKSAGSNSFGQCLVDDWKNVTAVACGLYHTCGLMADGSVRVVGKDFLSGINADGQRRTSESDLNSYLDSVSITPTDNTNLLADEMDADMVQQRSSYRYVSIACGAEYTAAVRSDGHVYAVGNNTSGQCDVRAIRGAIDVACGLRHTAVLLENHRVDAIGDNSFGQCDTEDWSDVAMVSCGERHTVGLKYDGTLIAAGDNSDGQCDLVDLKNIVSVTCLPEATLCVSVDGKVTARGARDVMWDFAQELSEVVALSACEYRAAALCSDGRVILSDADAQNIMWQNTNI